jgi:hypothetical protein
MLELRNFYGFRSDADSESARRMARDSLGHEGSNTSQEIGVKAAPYSPVHPNPLNPRCALTRSNSTTMMMVAEGREFVGNPLKIDEEARRFPAECQEKAALWTEVRTFPRLLSLLFVYLIKRRPVAMKLVSDPGRRSPSALIRTCRISNLTKIRNPVPRSTALAPLGEPAAEPEACPPLRRFAGRGADRNRRSATLTSRGAEPLLPALVPVPNP